MALFIVGIHNKANTPPLSPTTKTGRIIERILNRVGYDGVSIVVYKTNLYDTDYLPEKMSYDGERWARRVGYDPSKDMIVALGKEVYNRITPYTGHAPYRILNIAHPGSLRFSSVGEGKYITESSAAIRKFLIP